MKLGAISIVLAGIALATGVGKSQAFTVKSKITENQKTFENGVRAINWLGNSDSDKSTLLSRMKHHNVPGVSIVVFDNNQIVWSKGYGVANKEKNEKVTPDTIFQAASISKPVTAAGAFQMIDSGYFSLYENVNTRLVKWQVPDNRYTKTHKVTPSNIMSHTSGLSVSGFAGYNRNSDIPSIVQVLQGSSISNSDPVRVVQTPNKSESYSGGGTSVLQLLMEDTGKQPFPELMKQKVLAPLGMTNSTFDLQPTNIASASIAHGYDDNGKVIEGGYHLYPEKAAAGLWTTPTDLAKFMIKLGQAYRGEDETLLSQKSAKLMLTRVPGAGGMGVGIDGKGEAFRFRHTGGNAGFSCYAVSFANSGRGFIVMTNSDNGFALNHEISRAISEAYDWPALWMRE